MRIGFLATGTELITGETLNTSSPAMAERLTDIGVTLGSHLLCEDDREQLKKALSFLLTDHDAVIITGGLGPTSDDHTRWFVSEFTQQPLILDTDSLSRLKQGLMTVGRTSTPEQEMQCHFPKGAHIFPNHHGFADGFGMDLPSGQMLSILPGPPSESLPLFERYVLPTLQSRVQSPYRWLRWRLFGARESLIGPILEPIVQRHHLEAGYRIDYPYLHLKVRVPQGWDATTLVQDIGNTFREYLWVPQHQSASNALKTLLATGQHVLHLEDNATQGHLRAALTTPETHSWLHWESSPTAAEPTGLVYRFDGLEEFWKQHALALHHLSLVQEYPQAVTHECSFQIKNYSPITYAIEWACGKIWKDLAS